MCHICSRHLPLPSPLHTVLRNGTYRILAIIAPASFQIFIPARLAEGQDDQSSHKGLFTKRKGFIRAWIGATAEEIATRPVEAKMKAATLQTQGANLRTVTSFLRQREENTFIHGTKCGEGVLAQRQAEHMLRMSKVPG